MIRATSVVRRPAVREEKVADEITLDHQARHRRRIAMTADGGLAFLLDLEKAAILADGDAVKLEDGRLVRIKAASEHLVEVTTANPLRLMKVAWHLGNRHVPTEITESALYFAEDHVLLEMVRGLGAGVERVERPFRPEKGAYEAAEAHGGHAHDHGHSHDHGHDHAPDAHAHHAHGHEAHSHEAHSHEGHSHERHAHGADCGCGHDHSQDHAPHDHAGHDHAHHDHDHHDHDHHDHDPAKAEHRHGPGCGHDHG